MTNNAQVTTTTVTQTANAELGTPQKTLYYLIIETEKEKMVINVGQKTHDKVKLVTNQETTTKYVNESKAIEVNEKERGGKK